MSAIVIILVLAAMVVVISGNAYRRRAGVASGAGRGAPTSPVLVAVMAALVVVGALLTFYLLGTP